MAKEQIALLQSQGIDQLKSKLQKEAAELDDQPLKQVVHIQSMKMYQKKLNIRGSISSININDDLQVICGTKTGDIQFLQLDLKNEKIIYKSQIKSNKPITLPEGLTPGILYNQIDQPYNSTLITKITSNKNQIAISSLDDQILIIQNNKPIGVMYMQNAYSCNLTQNIFISTENRKVNIFTSKFQFIQQLIGHVEQINCIVPFQGLNQILSTSDDNTTRIFDYDSNSQLVYKCDAQGISCAILNFKKFITQTEKSILLHTRDINIPIDTFTIDGNFTIVQSIQNYNLIVAGSFDKVYFFKIENDKIQLIQIKELNIQSWVNDINMNIIDNQLYICVCTGKERKYDRMSKSQQGRSVVVIYQIKLDEQNIKKGRFK